MDGEIYLIFNYINNKVYIGQTIQGYKTRFYQHILEARKGGKTKLYKAIRELGEDNFDIKIICKADKSQLTNLEKQYIIQYNAIEEGYNSVLPIGNTLYGRYNSIADNIENIISDYLNGISYNNICLTYNISRNFLAEICRGLSGIKCDVDIKCNSIPKSIVAYDIEFNPITIFESIRDILPFITKLGYSSDLRNLYNYINGAVSRGNIAYGHRWQLASDLEYDNKIFRTRFDKEAYIEGGLAYKPEGKEYYVVDRALIKVKGYRNINTCKICGKEIGRGANLCVDCYNKKKALNIPDKEILQDLISKYSYEEIGRQYGVSGKAVRKWCDKYNLVEKHEGKSSGVTCVELELQFETFKEAANYLIDNKYTNATNVPSLAYKLSQAKRNNKKCFNLTWI